MENERYIVVTVNSKMQATAIGTKSGRFFRSEASAARAAAKVEELMGFHINGAVALPVHSLDDVKDTYRQVIR